MATKKTLINITGGAGNEGIVDLSTDVTGTLPIAHGGTNSSTVLGNGKLISSQSGALKEQAGIYLVQPSEGGSGIQSALNTASAAGGGIVQLVAGTYAVSSNISPPSDCSNVIIQGVGRSTILSSTITGNGYIFDFNQTPASAINGKAISNTTAKDTSVTLTTHSQAASFTAGMVVEIAGTDVDGLAWRELNEVLATGNGTTGVVTLKSVVQRTLTSVTLTGFVYGFGNAIKNLSAVFASGAAHFARFSKQVDGTLENLYLNGATGSANYALDLHMIRGVVRNCHITNFNIREDDGGLVDNCYAIKLAGNEVIFQSNHISSSGNSACTNRAGVEVLNIFSSKLIDNDISGNTGQGIRLYNSSTQANILIANNSCCGNTGSGIQVTDATTNADISIINNHCLDNGTADTACGIVVTALRPKVINNRADRNRGEGIELDTCSGFLVAGNQAKKNVDGIGIWIRSSTTGAVTGNTVNLNTGLAGIYVTGSSDVTISGNCFDANKTNIKLDGSNSDILISGNAARSGSTANLVINNSDANVLSTGNNYRGGTVTLGSGTNINSIGDMA